MHSVPSRKTFSLFLCSLLILSVSLKAQELYPFEENSFGDKKMGYRDAAGNIIVPAKYYEAKPFNNGLGEISLLDEKVTWRYGFVDAKGKLVIPAIYSRVYEFSEGLIGVELNGKAGFLDAQGKQVVPLKFEGLQSDGFREGLAAVKSKGKWGFIDKSGNTVIPFQYSECKYFAKGLAPVAINQKWGYTDGSGKMVISAMYSDANVFTGELSGVQFNEDKWAVINTAGKLLTGFKYDNVHYNYMDQQSDLIGVSIYNDKQIRHYNGVVDSKGNEIIPLQYRSVEIYKDGLIRLENFDKNCGLVNRKGKTVLPMVYKGIYFTRKDWPLGVLYDKQENGKLILAKGDKVELLKYQEFQERSFGRTGVMFQNKWGFLDENGNEIIPVRYDTVGAFYNDIALVMLNGKTGLIDRNGKEKIPVVYDLLTDAGEKLILAVRNDKWGYLDVNGKEIGGLKYEGADVFSEGLAAVMTNNKIGFIDTTGKLVIECKFSKLASRFSGGKAAVEKDGKIIMIDRTGKETK
jgi:hypothetical protein